MKKTGLSAIALCLSAGASFSATVYTVTTDASATYESPLALESASVTVDDGTASVVKPFSELIGAFETNSVFRKRGEGYLRSTPLFKTFTGEIRIEDQCGFDDLCQTAADLSGRQSLQNITIDDHQFRLMKCPDQIFAVRRIDRRFAADGTIHHRQKRSGYLNEINSTHEH